MRVGHYSVRSLKESLFPGNEMAQMAEEIWMHLNAEVRLNSTEFLGKRKTFLGKIKHLLKAKCK